MKCFSCETEGNIVQFSEEKFPCSDCDSEIVIGYDACSNCGFAWKTCNGVVLEDSMLDLDDIIPEKIDEFFSEEEVSSEGSMEDCIDRCLQCNSVCYKESEDVYKCPSCDFEWEIVTSG